MLQKDNLRFQVVDSTCRRLVVAVLMGLLYEGSKRWQRKKDGNEEVNAVRRVRRDGGLSLIHI